MADLTDSDLLTVMASEIHRIAKETDHAAARLPRSVFLAHSTLGKRYERLGTWSAVRARACGVSLPASPGVPAAPAVDVSGLDFDDEPDTAPGVPMVAVPDGHYVKGVSTMVGPDGGIKAQWIKTAKEQEAREAMMVRLAERLPATIPRATPVPTFDASGLSDDYLNVFPMGDPHIGMLAWSERSGVDFDLKTAFSVAAGAIDFLVDRAPPAREALLLNLGDFFHSDHLNGATTKGTPVDADTRMSLVLDVGRDLLVYSVFALLRTHEKVTVNCAHGNHDKLLSVVIAMILEAYFKDDPRVTVIRPHSPFFYRRFGRCLIGSAHGDMTKKMDLQKIMSVDRREDWGQVDHCFWYMGHVHHTSRVEDYGCVVETFRTLAPSDAWHHSKGYRSSRDMNRITLHRRWGEESRGLVKASRLEGEYIDRVEALAAAAA